MINNTDYINLQYLFVRRFVYNKHLLFNAHGTNIKVKGNNLLLLHRYNVCTKALHVHCLSCYFDAVMTFSLISERLEATTHSGTCSIFTEKQFQI